MDLQSTDSAVKVSLKDLCCTKFAPLDFSKRGLWRSRVSSCQAGVSAVPEFSFGDESDEDCINMITHAVTYAADTANMCVLRGVYAAS